MAYVAPSTVTTLQTYTSAAHNIIVNDIIDHEARLNSYAGVYTNETARDAAISSPTEGMTCYLTAPTIPAATGATTIIPSGIITAYNGSVWVCMSHVGAHTANQGYTTSTSYTSSLSGTPGTMPSVTLVTGATALVTFSATFWSNTAGQGHHMSVAVSGAGTVAASDTWMAYNGSTPGQRTSVTAIITGLTPGTNTFTMAHKSSSGANAAYCETRSISAVGIL